MHEWCILAKINSGHESVESQTSTCQLLKGGPTSATRFGSNQMQLVWRQIRVECLSSHRRQKAETAAVTTPVHERRGLVQPVDGQFYVKDFGFHHRIHRLWVNVMFWVERGVVTQTDQHLFLLWRRVVFVENTARKETCERTETERQASKSGWGENNKSIKNENEIPPS